MALTHAILATLLDSPCSGYDLRKRFEASVGFFWQASFQQIYRELGKLEEQGLVKSETIAQQGRPNKKVYGVTSEGELFLQEWIKVPSEIAPLRDDLLVKMFAGFVVSQETLLMELKHHRSMHQERLTVYQQIQENAFPNPKVLPDKEKFRYLTLRSGIRFETEWLAWCEEAIAALERNSASKTSENQP